MSARRRRLAEPGSLRAGSRWAGGQGGPLEGGHPVLENFQLSNQTHRGRTDPDATLAQKKGTPLQLKYKVHQTIDADSRVILDTEVTTGARQDNQPYLEQIQRVRDRCQLMLATICTPTS